MPVGAIIGGVVGGAASLGGAALQANAAKKAAKTQAKGAALAREDLEPYRIPGQGAMASLAELYGIDPGTGERTGEPFNEASLAAFRRSPDYEFARAEGLRGVEFSNAGKGMLRSGNNLRDLTTFSSGLATQNFDKYRGALERLAAIGQNAAAGTGNASQAKAAAEASGTVGAANAWGGAAGNIGNYAMLHSLMSNSAYKPPPTGALAPYSGFSNPTGFSSTLPGGVGAFPY
jgi:hypothetical protein